MRLGTYPPQSTKRAIGLFVYSTSVFYPTATKPKARFLRTSPPTSANDIEKYTAATCCTGFR
jgi:hypothetical protein